MRGFLFRPHFMLEVIIQNTSLYLSSLALFLRLAVIALNEL